MQQITQFARVLSGLGRNGDTMLAHITPREAAILKQLGGSGTINPRTGLREFWSESHVNDKTGGDGSSGGGSTKDRDRDGGTRAPVGTGNGAYGQVGNQIGKDAYGKFDSKGKLAPGITDKQTLANADALKDKLAAQGISSKGMTPQEKQNALNELEAMRHAYADSLDDGTGGIFSGITPFGERNPFTDPDFAFGQIDPNTGQLQTDANWGFDYVGAGLGVAGLFSPIGSLLNGAYKVGKWTGAIPETFGQANLGPSVFGGSAAPTGFGAAALGKQSATTSSASGTSTPSQPDIGRGGGTGYGSVISTNTTPPAPTAPTPEAQASPAVSSGPLPPGVSIIQPPVPIRNRDTGAWSSPFINGSGFSGGYGSIVRI